MVIKSKLTKEGFIHLNLILLYSKIPIKIYTACMAIWLLLTIVVATLSQHVSFIHVIGPLFMLTALPLLTYYNAVRSFSGNNRISETIAYHLDNENLSMKGESFNSQLSWGKIYKVSQLKNWILIWQNKQVGNPISKEDISKEQICALKEILNHHRVKNNL